MRVALAGALFMAPQLLLLDEPTNHLDLEAVLWLEEYLLTYEKTLIVVSHDRNFLQTVTTDIIHLHNKELKYYRGDFLSFMKTKEDMNKTYKKQYDAAMLQRQKTQDFIDKFRSNAKRASLVQSRIKMLDRMPEMEPPEDEKDFKMTFPPPEKLGRPVVAVSDVTFGYDPSKPPIVSQVDFGADQESRIGIMGPNGAGKTTLINLLLEKLQPQTGDIRRNPRLRLACFTQHHVDQLELNKSALDNLKLAFPDSIGDEGEDLVYRKHLGRFGVSGPLAMKPCRRLSGGEKSRVAIAMLTWNVPHIMVFDEPTNHLDLETTEALIKALESYGGGVIVVSHDQHFISSVCKELWIVGNGRMSRFDGTFEEYKKDFKKFMKKMGTA